MSNMQSLDEMHLKLVGSLIKISYKTIIGSIVCGMILQQLPAQFLEILHSPLVQFSVMLTVLDVSATTPMEYFKKIFLSGFIVLLMNSSVKFINILYKKYDIKKELAIFVICFLLLILQSPRNTLPK